MTKDLTSSQLDRKNILNNDLAIQEVQAQTGYCGIWFEDQLCFTKSMVADAFGVDTRTIERYTSENAEELSESGYSVLKGDRLKEFMHCIKEQDVPDINVGNISNRTPQLAVFSFKSFLNIAMLLTESENARILRQAILQIVMDFINAKTGGSTVYINQRDIAFLNAYLQEENYRKDFTDALHDCLDMGNYKYALYTDMIYQSIFREKAKEYRDVLRLSAKDRIRDTLYSEVLDLVAAYESGLAAAIRKKTETLGRKMNNWEMNELFRKFENMPLWLPLINSARTKMASRDLALRDAFHQNLKSYIKPLPQSEYERFLGPAGDELEKLMQENSDVLKRLKERE